MLMLVAVLLLAAPACFAAGEEDADALLQAARTALKEGKTEEALALVSKAIAKAPRNAGAHFLRGVIHERLGRHKEAVADLDNALKLDPKLAEAYDERGSARFKLGKIKESLEDFDRFLELRPQAGPGHWRRGIVLYYAGRYDDGRKQFEGYQGVDSNDVENAVWQFICAARVVGVDKARQGLLKIGHDRRVPMMVVYDLFAGKAKPEDVLAAAQAGKPSKQELNLRLFYAHLYLALHYEAAGDAPRTREHMTKAVKDHAVGGYMWEVARVHLELLERKP